MYTHPNIKLQDAIVLLDKHQGLLKKAGLEYEVSGEGANNSGVISKKKKSSSEDEDIEDWSLFGLSDKELKRVPISQKSMEDIELTDERTERHSKEVDPSSSLPPPIVNRPTEDPSDPEDEESPSNSDEEYDDPEPDQKIVIDFSDFPIALGLKIKRRINEAFSRHIQEGLLELEVKLGFPNPKEAVSLSLEDTTPAKTPNDPKKRAKDQNLPPAMKSLISGIKQMRVPPPRPERKHPKFDEYWEELSRGIKIMKRRSNKSFLTIRFGNYGLTEDFVRNLLTRNLSLTRKEILKECILQYSENKVVLNSFDWEIA